MRMTKEISALEARFFIEFGKSIEPTRWKLPREFSLLTKRNRGLFFSFGRWWKGVYVHIGTGKRHDKTFRFFVHKTKNGWRPGMDRYALR
jgi:hypothetical protein